MLRPTRAVFICALAVSTVLPTGAEAQTQPLPLPKGPRFAVKLDSSPQQAAVYVNDRSYGIQGYTPLSIKLPKGAYQIILELPNFKTVQVPIEVTRAQAFTVTLQRAPRAAVLDLRATADGNALGATIVVDGSAVGTLPNRVEVGPGNHVVEVQKAGFGGFRDNVQVGEGETRTMVVPLPPQVKPGSILVTADQPGATVLVDGIQKDTAPTVVNDLPEGAHTVEVRAGSAPPWKQVVTVVAGQQVKVAAQLGPVAPPTPTTGSLRVVSQTDAAEMFVDGEDKGPAGRELKGIEAGSHVVEVRAPGFAPQRAQVDIVGGQVKTLAIDLVPARSQTSTAGLRIISTVPDVDVFVDGASAGKAPFDRRDLAPGHHFIVARRPGFADFKQEVDLTPGGVVEVTADLRASGGLRIISNPVGASVFLDGAPVGVTPLSLADVPTGPHVVEIKQRDFVDGRQQINVDGGQQGIVQVDLVPVVHGPSPVELEKSQREESAWSAMTLEQGRFTFEGSLGYPNYLMARFQIGLLKFMQGRMGLDLGVELRSFFFDTELGLRPRVQLWRADPFAVGIDLAILGGGGPVNRNSFTFEIGPILTLKAGSLVHINLKPYLAVWSDKLCPSLDDIKADDMTTPTKAGGSGSSYKNEQAACKANDGNLKAAYANLPTPPAPSADFSTAKGFPADPRQRLTEARFVLQGSVEVAISRQLSLLLMLEGMPFQLVPQAFTGNFNPVFPTTVDIALGGRVGLIGKF